MSIWGLTWPWAKKKGRTFKRYDKIGRLRILCVGGGSPVTGEIEIQYGNTVRRVGDHIERHRDGTKSRWTRCSECDHKIRVTGPKAKPRLTVHNAYDRT